VTLNPAANLPDQIRKRDILVIGAADEISGHHQEAA
jgi:hypothetical protein